MAGHTFPRRTLLQGAAVAIPFVAALPIADAACTTNDPEGTVRALVQRSFDAIEQGDMQAIADCLSDDYVVWHSTNQEELSKTQEVELMGLWVRNSKVRAYESRRLHVFQGGFVQQHTLTCTTLDDRRWSMPACCIGKVSRNKITRVDEYIDSKDVGPLIKALKNEN